jgi:hypothetical protein
MVDFIENRPRRLLAIFLFAIAIGPAPEFVQAIEAAELTGGQPVRFNMLPPLPPNGFFAWCQTSPGFCIVQGNAPIASGTSCHCADYLGRTVEFRSDR